MVKNGKFEEGGFLALSFVDCGWREAVLGKQSTASPAQCVLQGAFCLRLLWEIISPHTLFARSL